MERVLFGLGLVRRLFRPLDAVVSRGSVAVSAAQYRLPSAKIQLTQLFGTTLRRTKERSEGKELFGVSLVVTSALRRFHWFVLTRDP